MKDRKNILIVALLIAIVAMSVGYAALAQQLTINGTANISASCDVKIKEITEKYQGVFDDKYLNGANEITVII